MPETTFRVRWPDGEVETCYSPSSIITNYFEPGRSYSLSDFVAQCREGLQAASDRVRFRYGGTGCSLAMAQLAAIERKAAGVTAGRSGREAVVRFEGFDA